MILMVVVAVLFAITTILAIKTVWTRKSAHRDDPPNPALKPSLSELQRHTAQSKPPKSPANAAFSPNIGEKASNARLVGGGRSRLRTCLLSLFPANRELTGNFSGFGRHRSIWTSNSGPFSVSYSQIPCVSEQGIIYHRTGIGIRAAGIVKQQTGNVRTNVYMQPCLATGPPFLSTSCVIWGKTVHRVFVTLRDLVKSC